MFVFVVPLKGQAASSNWSRTSYLCAQSIRSMLSSDARVILVCNQIPSELPDDPRLTIVELATPKPSNFREQMEDKYVKLQAGLIAAREYAPCWLMRADADDLISRRLVPFIEQQDCRSAWYCEQGWAYVPGRRWITRLGNFHMQCGTSCITYVSHEDLPHSRECNAGRFYLLTQGHNIIVDYLKDRGPVFPIPFRPVTYITDTGDNSSFVTWQTNVQSRKLKLKMLINRRFLTASIKHEFAME